MIFLSLTVCLWGLFPSQSVGTVTQQVQEIIKIKCVKWLRQTAHTYGKTYSKSSSGVFQDQVQEPARVFFLGRDNLLHRICTPDSVRPSAERTERRKRQRCSFSLAVASLQAGTMPAPKLITMEGKKGLGGVILLLVGLQLWSISPFEHICRFWSAAWLHQCCSNVPRTHRRHDIVTIGSNLRLTFKLCWISTKQQEGFITGHIIQLTKYWKCVCVRVCSPV